MKRKICIVTGTRAEYGILSHLIQMIDNDKDLLLQLVVTGMHLSFEFGLTYQEIENDSIKIDKKIEILLSSDTPIGISKSMGLAQISFSEAFDELKPDLLVLLGDRFEIFSAAASATVHNIPIAHLYGGELTLGAIDDVFRHSITKMSHLHFTSTELYKNRVIQLGEVPSNVHNVGALSVENIKIIKLLSKINLEALLNISFMEKNLLITFHPVTLEHEPSEQPFRELLNALSIKQDTRLIFTKCNADTNGRIINQMIDKFVSQHENACQFTSLGKYRYLNCLQYVDAVIGNSSSGIVEAPSFKIGTINIGNRQKGRIKSDQTIDVRANKTEILEALEKIYSKNFQETLSSIHNPYEKENTIASILKVIKSSNPDNLIKKEFYDINDASR